MIYVTVGTHHQDFSRLIRAMDDIARETREHTIIQIGMSTYSPQHCESFEFIPRESALDHCRQARLIVTHAGIGSVIDALSAHKPLIVVPRLKRYREHNSDHQLDLANAVERRGWGRMLTDLTALPELCKNPPAPCTNYTPARAPLIHAVRNVVTDAIDSREQSR